ncbi:MAG: prolyl oligopeptidase family serine peptidase [Yoonia sp.]|uniref:S9 family peptidase n=1 Tax=Yoonia sp. TaxID=2212373 RepID=UPI00273D8AC5|nr:prolyl oligopeptidase family serine peptidase [Yoonia sp.]MDP5084745.1 prolyl oligopeptidase family serine peptidase [Yoonia sp.]
MTPVQTLARTWAALPQIETLRASGDGAWAFWSWSGLSEVSEIWMAPTDGSSPPMPLTKDSADHLTLRDVSHDGHRLILAHSPDSCEHDQLLLLDRDKGNALTPLTPLQRDHYVYGGQFSPDGRSISYISDYDDEAQEVIAGNLIYLHDLETGARKILFRNPDPFGAGTEWSPDGQHLLWHRHRLAPGATQIWVIGADGSAPRELVCLGEKAVATGWWLDADRIAVVADGAEGDRVGIVTLADGAITWLAAEPELRPQTLVIGANGQFACHSFTDAALETVVFTDGTYAPLPNRSGRRSLLPLAGLPDGGWLAEGYDASAPHDVVHIGPDGTCTTLASAPTKALFSVPESLHWTAPDGETIQGWLYRPKGPVRGHITYVHGGPTWHSEDWVNPKIQFWVALGYSVLDPNYRGSTGRGMRWREKVKEDGWGGREQADIRAGTEAVIAMGVAPTDKIAVAGNSYGGFSSWYAITRHADLVTAAIPMCGMYKLDIDYNATEMPWGRAYSEEMMGGSPDEVPERYANASPGNFIDQIRGHVMVVHGLADSNVGPENTHVAVRELTAAGIPHEVMLFADEGHGVTRRANLTAYLERTAAFLERAFAKGRR